ncbi:CMRF35-like molecule 5 [Elgaria multicarinata webbii]|uniref:CMRF35-like molecule 5 n=1 Tax=Elgaria multicarinata webbii TaxID=159646 RepID=UPI002FCD32C2
MKIYSTLWIFLCADGFTAFIWTDKEKTAMEGTSITVNCKYNIKRYMFSKKYWCRGSSRLHCDILGDTDKRENSRVTVTDNRKGALLVTMKQLTASDSGTYWCGIDRPFADIMAAVELKVNKAPEIMRITPTSSPSSTVEVTTAFPVISKPYLNVTLPSNFMCHHDTTESFRNWNHSPWAILRWVILLILVASLIMIHWNRM